MEFMKRPSVHPDAEGSREKNKSCSRDIIGLPFDKAIQTLTAAAYKSKRAARQAYQRDYYRMKHGLPLD